MGLISDLEENFFQATKLKEEDIEKVASSDLEKPVAKKAVPASASRLSLGKRSTVILTVNGKTHFVDNVSPTTTLLWWLREELQLTGPKIGCGEGGCGACSVIETIGSEKLAINACLRLLVACDGGSFTTVEGLGSSKAGYSQEQLALADGNGSQCGLCSSGWVVAMHALRSGKKTLNPIEIERELDGNICRCTGYAPIVKAFKELEDIEDIQGTGHCFDVTTGAKCGRACDGQAAACADQDCDQNCDHSTSSCDTDSSSDLAVVDSARGISYQAPRSLALLYAALDSEPKASLVGGCTATVGVSKYYDDALGAPWAGGFLSAPASSNTTTTIIATKSVPELCLIETSADEITVGAAVTLSDLIACLEEAPETPQLTAAARHLKRVANTQVRNSGTWAGNLVLLAKASSFISDVLAALSVAEVKIDVSYCTTSTTSDLTRSVVSLEPTQLISALQSANKPVILKARIPLSTGSDTVIAYCDKVSARHSNAHAITNCALVMKLDGTIISKARCVFGGLSTKSYKMTKIESILIGADVSLQETLSNAVAALRSSATQPDSYQADLGASFLYKWFVKAIDPSSSIVTSLAFDRPETSSTIDIDGATDPNNTPASMPRTKLAARLQASGEAKYCTDETKATNEVFCAFAYAKSAGTLMNVSTTTGLRVLNTVAIYTAADLIEAYGAVGTLADDDDPLLYSLSDDVFVGSRVAIAVATTYQDAIQAARAVSTKVDASTSSGHQKRAVHLEQTDIDKMYATTPRQKSEQISAVRGKSRKLGLPPSGLEVRDGIVRLDFEPTSPPDIDDSVNVVRIEGSLNQSSQKHFTMETHAARAVPIEGGNFEVYSSSQDNALAQQTIAAALGVSDHKVVVKCRRVGGGFGSKLSLHLAAATAVTIVTDRLGRPARLHAERRDDQKMTGGREPCISSYSLTAEKDSGLMLTYEVDFQVEGGCATGDATGDLSMAVAWSDNVYKAQVKHTATSSALQTSAPRNTSMRSPGVLQSHCVHELAMVHLAHSLDIPVHKIQEKNFYSVGDQSPYGYTIGENGFNWNLPELWKRLKPKYLDKRDAATLFNAESKFKKRGVHITPTKYVMGLSDWKIPALVSIYADGSVEVTTGGCELGQGLYTKVAACCAYVLGIDLSLVRVGDTSTDKVPNSTCTGGSGTSESSCSAAMLACATLKSRLEAYITDDTEWTDAVAAALADGVELCATGWNDVRSDYDFDYATYGCAVAEVEVDVLTGEISILDLDVLMDQGLSLNADIDLGQIQGGLIMSLGFYFTEVNTIQSDGTQSGDGTWEYKPPMISDIPLKWKVAMLENSPNTSPVAVLRSKASGEPPMQLASALFLAARDAIKAARSDLANNTDWFTLPIPATPESIRAACLISDDLLTLPSTA